MMPLIDLNDLNEARYRQARIKFTRRHNGPNVPWLMFCLGFALGIALMLLAAP